MNLLVKVWFCVQVVVGYFSWNGNKSHLGLAEVLHLRAFDKLIVDRCGETCTHQLSSTCLFLVFSSLVIVAPPTALRSYSKNASLLLEDYIHLLLAL